MSWTVSASGYQSSTAAATCTFTSSSAVIACPNTLAANDKVVFSGTTAPTGLTFGTTYYVSATGLSAQHFEVSATPGGSVITPTTAGTAVVGTFEHIVASDTTNATYYPEFDMTPSIGGDVTELRAYDQILATGQAAPGNALAQVWKAAFGGLSTNLHKAFPFIPADQQIQITLKALANAYSGTCTFTASSANITFASNLLELNDVVQFTNSGGALPTGISANTNYYVITTGSPFTVSATLGGSAVVPTTAGTGTQTVTRVGHSFAYKLLRQ